MVGPRIAFSREGPVLKGEKGQTGVGAILEEQKAEDMEQHILKYEFHISKVLKFIEIY